MTCVDKNGGSDYCSGAMSDLCVLQSISVLHWYVTNSQLSVLVGLCH